MNLNPPQPRVFISLGSNQGDRAAFLRRAREALGEHGAIRVLRESKILENPAILHEEQPDFLNQIIEIETGLPAPELLRLVLDLEKELGRTPTFKNGPREIDIDILAYGDLSLNTADLKLPHPGIFDRNYLHNLLADMGESVDTLSRSDYERD